MNINALLRTAACSLALLTCFGSPCTQAAEITVTRVEVPDEPIIVRSDLESKLPTRSLAAQVVPVLHKYWAATSWEEALQTYTAASRKDEMMEEGRKMFERWAKNKDREIMSTAMWTFVAFEDEQGEGIFVQSTELTAEQAKENQIAGNPEIDPEVLPENAGTSLYLVHCFRRVSGDIWLRDIASWQSELSYFLTKQSRKGLEQALSVRFKTRGK